MLSGKMFGNTQGFPSGSTKQVPIAIPLIGRRRRGYQTIIEHDGRTFGKIAIPDASCG